METEANPLVAIASLSSGEGVAPHDDAAEIAPPVPEIRAGDLVVEGILAGERAYILRPVSATPDALERVRVRGFRVAVLGALIASRVAHQLGLAVLVNTGGRFLLAGVPPANWEHSLLALQREFDVWLFQHLQPEGELRCLLAGAVCQGDRFPLEQLEAVRTARRLQPHEGALRVGLRWNGRAFVHPAGPNIGECAGCCAVSAVRRFGDETLCETCAGDSALAARLALARARIVSESHADIPGPGIGIKLVPLAEEGAEDLRLDEGAWRLWRQPFVPTDGTSGFLAAGADGVSEAFAALDGDPARTLALARQLHGFFAERVPALIEAEFPGVFALYTGGAGALFIGRWQRLCDLAVRLHRDWPETAGNSLVFSAALVLASPRVHLATAAEDAAAQLERARQNGGDKFLALGVPIAWQRTASVVDCGKKLADWVERLAISPVWPAKFAELRAAQSTPRGVRQENDDPRNRPTLAALVSGVKHPAARSWAAEDGGESSEREMAARYARAAANKPE